MNFGLNLIARALQILFSIIVLGLSAYVVSEYDDLKDRFTNGDEFFDTPGELHYLIFVAVWTLLVLAFLMLAPKLLPSIASNIVILALEFLTMLFWFAGFIALAIELDDTPCDNYDDLSDADDSDYEGECDSANAATKAALAFTILAWLTFAYTFGMAALNFWKNRSSSGTGNPPMQQSA